MAVCDYISKSVLRFSLMLYFCLGSDTFSWSPRQLRNHASRLGSIADLSCDFILSTSEKAPASSFSMLTWSREQPRGSGHWSSLVLDSPSIFGRQDLNLQDRFHFGIRSSLRVYDVKEEDDTDYMCEYRSSFPTAPRKVRLNVQYKPKETKLKTETPTMKSGQYFTLNCTARANPSPWYQIYRNDELLQNSSSGIFRVNNVDETHSGKYKCVPINQFGEGPEKTIAVTIEGSSTSVENHKSFLNDFPMWAFGALAGGCLIVILLIVVAYKCRNGAGKEGVYQPKRSEHSNITVSSLNLANGSATKSGPDMYTGQIQEPQRVTAVDTPTKGSTVRREPIYSSIAPLKETAIDRPADHPEAYDGPYTNLRKSTDLDQQYKMLDTFGARRKSNSDKRQDHPESHEGPCSNRDSSEVDPSQIEEIAKEEIEEPSRSASPAPEAIPIYIDMLNEVDV